MYFCGISIQPALRQKNRKKMETGRLQKNTSAKQGATKIVIIITTIIVMHSTVMIAVPALLSLDIFRKEEECKRNFWWGRG